MGSIVEQPESRDYPVAVIEECVTHLGAVENALAEYDESYGDTHVLQYLSARFSSLALRLTNGA